VVMQPDPFNDSYEWIPGFEDSGEHAYTVTVSDGELYSDGVLEVEVVNTNRLPVIHADSFTVLEGTHYVLANTTDLDNNNSVTNDDNVLLTTYDSVFNATGGAYFDYESDRSYSVNINASDGIELVTKNNHNRGYKYK